jgi:hypothetical protein
MIAALMQRHNFLEVPIDRLRFMKYELRSPPVKLPIPAKRYGIQA